LVPYELFIARRYLRSSRKTGFISIITYMAIGGVVLGVAALIIILSVTNGFSGEVQNRLIGMNAHVTVRRFDGEVMLNYRELLDRLREFPEVVGIAPVVDSKVIIASKRNLHDYDGCLLWGIDPESFGSVSDMPEHLQYDPDNELMLGDLPDKKYPGIVLGEQLANRLRVGPGSEVFLMTLRNVDLEDAVMDGFKPHLRPFLVTDTFESGMYQYDDQFAFIALEDAQRILDLEDGATHIHIRVQDVHRATQVKEALQEEMGYPYRVTDWSDIFPEFFNWIKLEKWAIFIALSLIILVAAFNIMSILSMSILIKTPEIGILRAMGSTTRSIRRIFMYQGLVIGVVGTVFGCLTGFVICYLQQRFELISLPGDVYLINSLPVDMELLDFLLVAAVSLSICLLTSVYPARKASALMPVEAIRYIM
jgi:lipoprotein-releasing system permease protein